MSAFAAKGALMASCAGAVALLAVATLICNQLKVHTPLSMPVAVLPSPKTATMSASSCLVVSGSAVTRVLVSCLSRKQLSDLVRFSGAFGSAC